MPDAYSVSHLSVQSLFVRMSSGRWIIAFACGFSLVSLWLWAYRASHVWACEDVPVAFWSWNQDAPSDAEIEAARAQTKADTFFIRAGQFDIADDGFTRTRDIAGHLPRRVFVHLVYNASPAMLERFAEIDTKRFAARIAETYREDAARAERDGCRVAGLQLDIDAPTSQLPRYAALLRLVREAVPPATQISITGLPTWMDAPVLKGVLDQTDFWIPQFYGDLIPKDLSVAGTITAPLALRRQVIQARRLSHPFYAGLAAYSHALLYSKQGTLIALRGDITANDIVRHNELRLIKRQAFPVSDGDDAGIGEWRYVFQATGDMSVGSWNMRTGEYLVLNVPSAAGLRHAGRTVRAEAEGNLRGICVFRLPRDADETTLTNDEIARALLDKEAFDTFDTTRVRLIETSTTNTDEDRATMNSFTVAAINGEATGARLGEDAFNITLRVPRGTLQGVARLEGFAVVESLCEANRIGVETMRPCSWQRANVVRLRAFAWQAGTHAHATLITRGTLPASLEVQIDGRTTDVDRQWRKSVSLPVDRTMSSLNQREFEIRGGKDLSTKHTKQHETKQFFRVLTSC